MIDLDRIQQEYQLALSECDGIFPISKWAHTPQPRIILTSHKTKYGMATADGKVHISKAFLGTRSLNKLKATLRHELAHLAAGVRHQHNRVFRRFESEFGGNVKSSAEEIQAVHDNIPYKWQVIAHLANGKVKDIGGAHRRSRRFSEYSPKFYKYMTVDGIKVKHFEFVEN